MPWAEKMSKNNVTIYLGVYTCSNLSTREAMTSQCTEHLTVLWFIPRCDDAASRASYKDAV